MSELSRESERSSDVLEQWNSYMHVMLCRSRVQHLAKEYILQISNPSSDHIDVESTDYSIRVIVLLEYMTVLLEYTTVVL